MKTAIKNSIVGIIMISIIIILSFNNYKLRKDNETKLNIIEGYRNEKEKEYQKTTRNILSKVPTIDEIIFTLKNDYLDFYCPTCNFRNFKVKILNTYEYDISFSKIIKEGYNRGTFIIRMTYNYDFTEFSVKDIEGYHKWECQ